MFEYENFEREQSSREERESFILQNETLMYKNDLSADRIPSQKEYPARKT